MITEPNGTVHRTKQKRPLLYQQESYLIRGSCFAIYKQFRNTQKEKIYQRSLYEELKVRGLNVEREKQLPIYYLKKKVGTYIPDLLVNNAIIIELKAKPFLHRDDISQFWHYLKNSEFHLGFLVNFGEANGVKIERRVYHKDFQRDSVSSSD